MEEVEMFAILAREAEERRALFESERKALEEHNGQVWDTDQLREDFDVIAFAAPLVVVRRKRDGRKGTMEFQHAPRFYWGFVPE